MGQKQQKEGSEHYDLEGSETLHHLGDTVLSDGVGESRPGRRVGEFGPAGEQWVVTLGAHVHTCKGTVIFKSRHII